MSVYLQADKYGDSIQVASNRGWSDFMDWLEDQDAPRTRELIEEGSSEDFAAVRIELEILMANDPPEDEDVVSVAEAVISAIVSTKPGDVVLITNGVTA